MHIFHYVVEAVIAVAAFFVNVIVISCFLRFSELRTVTNKYILNLSITCLGGSFFTLGNAIQPFIYEYEWTFSEILCKLYLATMSVHTLAIAYFLVIMCVDRYLAIVWPASRTRFVSNVVMTAAWIVSALLSIPTFMYTSLDTGSCFTSWPGGEDNSDFAVKKVYIFILGVALPIVLIIIFNILVTQRVKVSVHLVRSSQTVVQFNRSAADGDHVNARASVVDQSNRSVQVDREVNDDTRKASIHVIIVTAMWALCTIPYAICFLVFHFNSSYVKDSNFFSTLDLFFLTLTICELLLPTFYALLNDNYRKCTWKLLTCAAVVDVNATLREERSVPRSGVDVTTLLQPSVLPYRVLE